MLTETRRQVAITKARRTLSFTAASSSSSSTPETDPSAAQVCSSVSLSLITFGAAEEPEARSKLVVAGAGVVALSAPDIGLGPLSVISGASTTVFSRRSVLEPSLLACELAYSSASSSMRANLLDTVSLQMRSRAFCDLSQCAGIQM